MGKEDGLTRSTGDQKSGLGPLRQAKHVECSHEGSFQCLDRIDLIMGRRCGTCKVINV